MGLSADERTNILVRSLIVDRTVVEEPVAQTLDQAERRPIPASGEGFVQQLALAAGDELVAPAMKKQEGGRPRACRKWDSPSPRDPGASAQAHRSAGIPGTRARFHLLEINGRITEDSTADRLECSAYIWPPSRASRSRDGRERTQMRAGRRSP